ncbi:prepilin-type N-terminal cleavage/methylation domain-containing protein [Vagococcus sp. BWB3-3]|uniref:Prepilin-type N-terminal cleavage/methylation domain-containing protein n=1 Tax=Vagococcus allomyrinae TaxID=2794353 RepID=A0A940SX16_9ENTE|nr:prepilin-type N-terminal cleavage/methylation domain-containing protein [Vagococcus allomyrinae]MBP1042776.1 prepilin-type N-terminal cleavage/methylation domain-containing protein [Vagococcus allomyrinae]
MTNVVTLQERKEGRFNRIVEDEQGLTLVELLATVVILAIIMGVGALAIGKVIQNSREDAAISNIQQALNAGSLYQMNELTDGATGEFGLDEVKTKGYIKQVKSYGTLTDIKFTVGTDGELSVKFPTGQLKAGSKSSKEFDGDVDAASNLDRTTLFD